MGTIMKNNINYSGGGSGASTAAAVSYNNTASGLTSGNAQGAIDELAGGLASKADISALDGKADRLTYNESSSTLLLQSGGVTLSSVHIEGGSIATIVHVQTHEQSWWNNPAVTIDVKDSDEDINNGHFDANGDYVVKVHHLGTYTVTVTDDQGHKYVTTFEDNQLGAILYVFIEPYGWEGWLNAASMATTAYSSLDDVLADEKALRELFTKHASVDYLVTWLGNTSADEVAHQILDCDLCAKWINLRDYALDMLYANAVIKAVMDEVGKYGYGEWALVGQVPNMTSNTKPWGEAFADSDFNDSIKAYKVFDGDNTTEWAPNSNSAAFGSAYVGYKFNNPSCVKSVLIGSRTSSTGALRIKGFRIEASNDCISWDAIFDGAFEDSIASGSQVRYKQKFSFNNDKRYLAYRLVILSGETATGIEVNTLQFYAWQPKGNIPVMTSNTAPYGEVIYKNYANDSHLPYYAFDNNIFNTWTGANSDVTNQYIGYKFTNPICVKKAVVHFEGMRLGTFKIQASNDNSTWVDISDVYTNTDNSYTVYSEILDCSSNNDYYLYYRLFVLTTTATDYTSVMELQFYGRQLNVSVPIMTSNTEPWGEASSANPNSSGWEAYKSFDNNKTTGGDSNSNVPYSYKFISPMVCKMTVVTGGKYNNVDTLLTYKVVASNDGSTWDDLTGTLSNATNSSTAYNTLDNNKDYLYYGVVGLTGGRPGYINATPFELQFFGLDYSEHDERHYIYDHGVELEAVTKTNTSVLVTIDTTSYDLLRATVGTHATITDKLVCGSGNVTIPSTMMPNNCYLGISSINGSNQTGFSVVADTSDISYWLE